MGDYICILLVNHDYLAKTPDQMVTFGEFYQKLHNFQGAVGFLCGAIAYFAGVIAYLSGDFLKINSMLTLIMLNILIFLELIINRIMEGLS